jgi:hypothetical protein
MMEINDYMRIIKSPEKTTMWCMEKNEFREVEIYEVLFDRQNNKFWIRLPDTSMPKMKQFRLAAAKKRGS